MAKARKIKYAGKDFEVMADAGKDYFVMRAVISAKRDPACIFDAYDLVFMGKTDEYAEELGRDFELLNGLFSEALDGEAKN